MVYPQEINLLDKEKLLKIILILNKVLCRLLDQVAREFMRVEFLVVIPPIKKSTALVCRNGGCSRVRV